MRSFMTIFASCILLSGYTQDRQEKHDSVTVRQHSLKGTHRLTLGLGHTQVSQGKVNGDTKRLFLVSWSLNYDYWVGPKSALGLQSDLIVESFVIEDRSEELIERKYPISLVQLPCTSPASTGLF